MFGRRGAAHMGFSARIDTILNRTELYADPKDCPVSEEDVVMMCAGKAARYLCSANEECADHMDCRMSQGRYVCACVDGYVAKVNGSCGKN